MVVIVIIIIIIIIIIVRLILDQGIHKKKYIVDSNIAL